MTRQTLDEENLIDTTGISDRDFADHSGDIQQGYELGSLTRGLVAYYPMEEGQGQVLHDGALDNLGQINGATWNGSGQVGSDALSFDGTSDWVDVPQPVNPNSDFSVSAWVKTPDGGEFNRIISNYQNNNTWFNIGIRTNGNAVIGLSDSNTTVRAQGTSDITDNTWHHVTAIRRNGTIEIWVDGTRENTGDVSSLNEIDNSQNQYLSDSSGSNPWNGPMDDVRIYDRALSQPEIEALYNLTSPSGYLVEERDVPTFQLDRYGRNLDKAVARYEFEGNATDSWGSNDGTNEGVTFVDGVYGQSGDFESANSDRVVLPNFGFASSTSFTLSAWAKFDTTGTRDCVIGRYNNSNGRLIHITAEDSDYWRFRLGRASTNQSITLDAGQRVADRWYHVVGTYDSTSGQVRLHLDGNIIAEQTEGNGGDIVYDFSDSDGLYIGSRNDGLYTDGQIDDVRIYERALDPTEVEQLFNKGAYRIKRGDL